jgi:hypothetical protein
LASDDIALPEPTYSQINNAFTILDRDNSGAISFPEFEDFAYHVLYVGKTYLA